ncbi:SDR family NAD(P)-dependent oxidoreductase [Haloechinothrix salitolerans]|uniref:SDR family NAD(P)-dependent oxidoreductase n=2 Tax=Haloechinothrix salitolerans TaxID=926830 RepID=A0ABW2BZB3_9PSEU
MSLGVSGRIVVITGASRGLGRRCAELFAKEGASLGLLSRDLERLRRLAAILPCKVAPIQCDVADANSVARAFEEVASELGGADSVVSNAGVLSTTAKAQNLPIEVWNEVIGTNLSGAFHVARYAHRYLRASRRGRMVFVSSGAARLPMRGSSSYVASKAGIEGLTRALCSDWATDDICVNAVAPGYIENGDPNVHSSRVRDSLLARIPLRRAGDASEFAKSVLFLAGDFSSYITGQTLRVDGGYGIG